MRRRWTFFPEPFDPMKYFRPEPGPPNLHETWDKDGFLPSPSHTRASLPPEMRLPIPNLKLKH